MFFVSGVYSGWAMVLFRRHWGTQSLAQLSVKSHLRFSHLSKCWGQGWGWGVGGFTGMSHLAWLCCRFLSRNDEPPKRHLQGCGWCLVSMGTVTGLGQVPCKYCPEFCRHSLPVKEHPCCPPHCLCAFVFQGQTFKQGIPDVGCHHRSGLHSQAERKLFVSCRG